MDAAITHALFAALRHLPGDSDAAGGALRGLTRGQLDDLAAALATLDLQVERVYEAAAAAEPRPLDLVRHNHDGGKALPWGRLMAAGACPRCDELRAGAAPREAHPAIQASARRRDQQAEAAAALREHHAGDRHRSGGCGPVCTFGDW